MPRDDSYSPVTAAYADPPYLGRASYYVEKEEVDHERLIARLAADFDGWALSASSSSLSTLLPMCPERVRVGAWVKPWCSFKPGQTVAYAWEPVLFVPARARPRTEPTLRDWISANATTGKGLKGAKPKIVCEWLFGILGLRPGDELADLFPGTGIVSERWDAFSQEAVDVA